MFGCCDKLLASIGTTVVLVYSACSIAGIVDSSFERLCVLFNIASLMSQVGNEANLQTDDGLKTAAKYFQV